MDNLIDVPIPVDAAAARALAEAERKQYLTLAAAGGADVIVCSDDHLLHLHPWQGIAILYPRDFIARAATIPS